MSNPATGNQALFGFRREIKNGVPDTTTGYVFRKATLPATMGLQRSETPSNQVNASGYTEPGVPGPVGTSQDFGVRMSAGASLELFENLLGGVTKETLEPGVYRYTFEQDSDQSVGSLDVVWALAPTNLAGYLFGLKIDSITTQVAQTELEFRMAMTCLHGTRIDLATADGGNTGTYRGPILRGVMARAPKAPIHISITRDSAGGGLRYKAEQTSGTPTFPGDEVDAVLSAGQPIWQNLQVALRLSGTASVVAGTAAVTGVDTQFLTELAAGQYLTLAGETLRIDSIESDTALTLAANHTAGAAGVAAHVLNRDAGYWGANKDPVEILFPLVAEHGTADVGDLWTFAHPGSWAAPTPTYLDFGHPYTSAHWDLEVQEVQEVGSWAKISATGGQSAITWQTTASTGNLSKYPNRIYRAGQPLANGSFTRELVDDFFLERVEAHRRFALRESFLGRQLGTGDYRESIEKNYPYAAITERTAPVQGASEPVIETVNWQAESNPDTGSAPMTVVVITDRDWTPS